MENRITKLFGIDYPIIQGGMVWVSGYKLASAVSNAGGLGLIGAGSMYPEVLASHIEKCKMATDKPFGVNLPLLYADIEAHVKIILESGVKIVFTSAGNPKTLTPIFKEHGIVVVHVVSSLKFALKAQAAGVDAVVLEGFEAGGHNGREELTTMSLMNIVDGKLDIPYIAAGGIANGKTWKAMEIMGAEGVQVGSRFAVCKESSAHDFYKKIVFESGEADTVLTLKELAPVRLIKNPFYEQVQAAYAHGANKDELITLLGRARAKRGVFEGNWEEGEFEVGQIAAVLSKEESAAEVIEDMLAAYKSLG